MTSGSTVLYGRLMKSLPGTAREISERTGMTATGLRVILRRLWALKLVHPGDSAVTGRSREAIWMSGEGDAVQNIRTGPPMRPGAQHIAFATIWRMLEDGASVPAIHEGTGVSRSALYRLLAEIKPIIHVAAWDRDGQGRPLKVWMIGVSENARKPKLSKREIQARYRDRVVTRAILGQDVSHLWIVRSRAKIKNAGAEKMAAAEVAA